ncbi:hypothetical protein [Pseudanabaena sp. 'Roaring Creek']|nr:hypothetical protein [Pseudanabaena sp. 'Roaring Creek']
MTETLIPSQPRNSGAKPPSSSRYFLTGEGVYLSSVLYIPTAIVNPAIA